MDKAGHHLVRRLPASPLLPDRMSAAFEPSTVWFCGPGAWRADTRSSHWRPPHLWFNRVLGGSRPLRLSC